MNEYDRSIFESFKYYHREWGNIKDDNLSKFIGENIKKPKLKFKTYKITDFQEDSEKENSINESKNIIKDNIINHNNINLDTNSEINNFIKDSNLNNKNFFCNNSKIINQEQLNDFCEMKINFEVKELENTFNHFEEKKIKKKNLCS